MVDPLASKADVEAALLRTLTTDEESGLALALAKASAQFRREAKQVFTPSSSSVRLKVNAITKHDHWMRQYGWTPRAGYGVVHLRQRPVNEVTAVVDDYGSAVRYTLYDQWLEVEGLSSSDFVRVNYTHGDAEVPDEVRYTVAAAVARGLTIPEQVRAGVTQTSSTTGPFQDQDSYAAWAVGGGVNLSPAELEVARSFRPITPKHWVAVSRL